MSHHDNLEFLEDVIPKTAPYKQVKNQAAATRAKLKGEKTTDASAAGRAAEDGEPLLNGKKQKSAVNGSANGFSRSRLLSTDEDPSSQLELEMRQAHRPRPSQDGDVDMTG